MGILKLEVKQQVGEKKSLPKKPKQTQHCTDLFGNDILDITLEKNLWAAGAENQVKLSTPEPFIKEEDCFKSIWDINIMVSEDCAPPSEARILAENNDLSENSSFPSDDLDDNWGHGSYHAPAAVVEGREDVSDTIDAITNSDMLRYALDECNIAGFQEEENEMNMITVEVYNAAAAMLGPLPQASTNSFIHYPEQLLTIDHSPITSRHMTDFTAAAKKLKEPTSKKVGRPERQTPLEITEVPRTGSVSVTPEEMRKLKYRRMRDLNNEASKKCRMNRKQKLNVKEKECQEVEEKYKMLTEKLQQIELEAAGWRLKCKDFGIDILEDWK